MLKTVSSANQSKQIITHCPISGHSWSMTSFSHAHIKGKHPVFTLDWPALEAGYYELTNTNIRAIPGDSVRLLILTILNRTGLVNWSVSSERDFPLPVPLQCLPRLFEFASFFESNARVITPENRLKTFAQIIITPENRNMQSLPAWLDCWESNINDYWQSLAAIRAAHNKALCEEALDRLALRATTNPIKHAKMLASWAALATGFPTRQIVISTGHSVSCSAYWQLCIRFCAESDKNKYQIAKITLGDLYDIQNHVLERLDYSSIYSFALTKLLNHGIDTLKSYQLTDKQISERQEIHKKQFIEGREIIPKPERHQFIKSIDYHRAVALYNSQQAALGDNQINPFK